MNITPQDSSRWIFDGQSSKSVTIVATDVTVGYCGSFVLSVSYSPTTTTSNLISIGSEVFADDQKTVVISMANSNDENDENIYTINVDARYSS